MPKFKNTNTAIAALNIEIDSADISKVHLLPVGRFRAVDGRPVGIEGWYLDEAIAATLIADVAQRQTDCVIDFEHQTLRSVTNGQPAVAAGWFKKLVFDPEHGLSAVDVRWVGDTETLLREKKYRYASAVFSYDKKTGAVTRLLHAALTNTPAIDQLDEIIAASTALITPSEVQPVEKEQLTELLSRLKYFFNLPELATHEDIFSELNKLIKILEDSVKDSGETVAASSIFSLIEDQRTKIVALSQKQTTTDNTTITALSALQSKVASLETTLAKKEREELITAALSDGRLTPSLESWAQSVDIAALSSFLMVTPPKKGLSTQQSSAAKTPPHAPAQQLTSEELAICSQFNLTPEEFLGAKNNDGNK